VGSLDRRLEALMTCPRDNETRHPPGGRAAILLAAALLLTATTGALATAPPPVENQVREIRGHPTLAHTVSGLRVKSHLPLYEFLLAHPDITAALARALDAATYQVSRDGENGYRGQDGKGAEGHFMLVEQGEGRRVFFAQGTYKKPLLPTIAGRLVLILEYRTDGAEEARIENRVQGFVQIDTAIVGTLAKIARPLVKRSLDKKVHHLFEKVNRLVAAASANPAEAIRRLQEKGTNPSPDLETLRRLLEAELANKAPAR
jgi:hypothetical protein